MRIAFVTYQGYDGAGVLHAHSFAQQLVDCGHEVLFLLCGDPATTSLLADKPRYLLRRATFEKGALDASLGDLIEAADPEIIHLWTPRHLPARVGLESWSRTAARLVIHYEDDEEFILSEIESNQHFGTDDLALYRAMRGATLDFADLTSRAESLDLPFLGQTLLDPWSWPWIHPLVTPLVEKLAAGFTVISTSYARSLAERGEQPVRILYPGVDRTRFTPEVDSTRLRRKLGLVGKTVLLYSGPIAEFHDFMAFLAGLARIVADYPDVVVVQVGHNHIPQITGPFVERSGLASHVLFAGPVPHRQMHRYLGLADLFLGVAATSRFNAHRLPSKLPEYMAMARPIVLAEVGFGRELDDGTEVVKIGGDEPDEVEQGLRRALLLRPFWPDMGRRLRQKAEQLFDWRRNAEQLVAFYDELLEVEEVVLPQGFEPRGDASSGPSWSAAGARADPVAHRPRVLVVTEGRIGRQMSGVGIRYLELARALAGEHDVTVAHTGPVELTIPGVRQLHWSVDDGREVLRAASAAQAILVHGYVLHKLPRLAQCEGLLVVDLYCPFLFENLEIHRDRGVPLREREAIHDNDLAVLNDQLLAGDYFLTATEAQRDWLLGALTALGRLRPITCPPRSSPGSFVAVVPFGSARRAAGEPGPRDPVMRGVWPGIEPDDVILLWGGGIWSWLDPLTPLRAMARVARERSDVKFVFLSTRTAQQVVAMPILGEVFHLVEQSEELQRVVVFNSGYIDYERRAAYFAEADVGICAHAESLETHFAFRTRIWDYLSAGLPVLTTAGDHFGRLVEEQRLGRVLPFGDVEAWVEAILALADAETREGCRRRILESPSPGWSEATAELREVIRRGPGPSPLRRRRAPPRQTVEAPWGTDLDGLSIDALFDLALGRLRALEPEAVATRQNGAALAQRADRLKRRGDEFLARTRNLEEELVGLRAHAARMEDKLELLKRIPLAAWTWRFWTTERRRRHDG